MDRILGIEELLNEAGWLRRLAASLVRDAAQAEDLVQDTWVAALRRPPRSRDEPRPWLARVARNLAHNARRSHSRREVREDLAHEERANPGPDALAQEAEAQRLLAEAVTRLAEPLRAVIVLRYFQGLDSSAAAARLAVPASTVRTRLQKALEELRAELDRRFEGGRRSWAAFLAPLANESPSAASAVLGPAAARAASLGSWPVLVACAGAACVLATLGTTYWRGAQEDQENWESASLPAAAPRVAAVASVAAQETATPSAGNRQALEASAEPDAVAVSLQDSSAVAASITSELSGTILVDGRPPEWPIQLALEAAIPPPPAEGGALRRRMKAQELTLMPEQRGVFTFGALSPGWSGRFRVNDYAFVDGESSLAVDAPASGLVFELRSGPEIVGRIRGPDGPAIPGLEGGYRLRIESEGETAEEVLTSRFFCRADGRFRIPSQAAGERGSLTILVEDADHGYLLHEPPSFLPAARFDLGELELEPLRALEFTVRDPSGAPIEGAFARVNGLSWLKRAPLTGADGSGVLELAPDRPVDVRFSAVAHADRVLRVEPGSAPEVVLEPLAALEVRLHGSLEALANRVLLSTERPAFLWEESGWDESAEFQLELDRTRRKIYARRTPSAPGERFEYEFALEPDGRVELAGLTPDLVLTIEVLDTADRSLSVDTVSVGRAQRATLELGEADSAGSTPAPEKRMLRIAPESRQPQRPRLPVPARGYAAPFPSLSRGRGRGRRGRAYFFLGVSAGPLSRLAFASDSLGLESFFASAGFSSVFATAAFAPTWAGADPPAAALAVESSEESSFCQEFQLSSRAFFLRPVSLASSRARALSSRSWLISRSTL